MPIVPASKADPDDLDYAPIRPSQKDRDTDDIKKKLQKIESDRREALKRKENSSQLKPPTESGYTHPTFDEEHGCWKIQSLKDSRTVKIWDEKRDIWRDKPRNSTHIQRCRNASVDVKANWRRF